MVDNSWQYLYLYFFSDKRVIHYYNILYIQYKCLMKYDIGYLWNPYSVLILMQNDVIEKYVKWMISFCKIDFYILVTSEWNNFTSRQRYVLLSRTFKLACFWWQVLKRRRRNKTPSLKLSTYENMTLSHTQPFQQQKLLLYSALFS